LSHPAITIPKQCPRPQEAPTLAAVKGGINLNMANVLVIQNKRKFLQVCSDIGFVVSKTPVHYTRGTILSGKLSEGKTSSHPVFAHAFLIQMEKVQ